MAGRSLEWSRRVGKVVLGAIDKGVSFRWEPAKRLAESTRGTRKRRIRQVTKTFARELGVVGAASGATATVPGLGTTAVVGTAAAELGWFTLRASDLILTIGAIHGHTEATVEERRAWVLSVLAFGDTASPKFVELARQLGQKLDSDDVAKRLPLDALTAINRAMARKVVTNYGAKRGAVAVGRAVPFGVGAVLGGSLNYSSVRGLARQADRFFSTLPPGLQPQRAPAGVRARAIVTTGHPSH